MRARIYISISGRSFDPQAFHAKAGKVVGGGARRRKHSGAPLADVPLDYWVSSETEVTPQDVGSALSGLLGRMLPLLGESDRKSAEQIFAHVVLEFDEGEEPVGLHFPQQVISQLNQIGADLDIDAVPLLRAPR